MKNCWGWLRACRVGDVEVAAGVEKIGGHKKAQLLKGVAGLVEERRLMSGVGHAVAPGEAKPWVEVESG